MTEDFNNVYEDSLRAEAYSRLEFPGTYYLAYRDLPQLIAEHVTGKRALDFGCGAGRSTRFLEQLGFEVIGVDISESMIRKARELNPKGDYRLISEDGPTGLKEVTFDLILAAFTFDNISTTEKKLSLFTALGLLLSPGGRIINLVSSPQIYTHEWASFTTKDFPENHNARSGDRVKIIMTDVVDRRPVEDILFTEEAYRDVYRRANLEIISQHSPLARTDEPFAWVNEITISPWVIYILEFRKS
ncbi:MAG: class I SAM-dependent methyltransferase [Candidatus Zixiibacteriota bacterium]